MKRDEATPDSVPSSGRSGALVTNAPQARPSPEGTWLSPAGARSPASEVASLQCGFSPRSVDRRSGPAVGERRRPPPASPSWAAGSADRSGVDIVHRRPQQISTVVTRSVARAGQNQRLGYLQAFTKIIRRSSHRGPEVRPEIVMPICAGRLVRSCRLREDRRSNRTRAEPDVAIGVCRAHSEGAMLIVVCNAKDVDAGLASSVRA